MAWLGVFKHLLPHARAWRITIDKALRQLFAGLSGAPQDVQEYQDGVWSDYRPQDTTKLVEWEQQFALPASGLTTQQRRDRLDGVWKALGGQSPGYLQDTLQGAGFDVYVHEWWEPSVEHPAGGAVDGDTTPLVRNPLLYLSNAVVYTCEAGEAVAEAGEALAAAGERTTPVGYPLVNKTVFSAKILTLLAGEASSEAGEALAEAGQYSGFEFEDKEFVIPADPDTWQFFLYVGGATFPEAAGVGTKRRDEFESLCLKICPTEQWLGILVEYT